MTVLTDIYRAPDDDPKVKDSHRVRAGRMLVDRITAMYPTAVRSAADGLVLSSANPEQTPIVQDRPSDDEIWAKIDADLKQLEDEGILTPDPDAPPIDISIYRPPEDYVMPPEVAAEEAAKFWAEIDLRVERRKKWPEIEERRRKKLAQIYPSHSEDESPET